ncbi:LPS export ABC transporter periplasmic protein LptC [Roseateles sp. SL47]|uniref:LPS export ABC transporter periplasmic protein LptC n=1 Tax=Roseateles sp. SL47 TaxID=2995138 RepID=UPI00226EBF5A|nr:LPS export ABC transporter periplasmic protein LptC [Roseateles sp. SL47]WAC74174.1 LPS export ABC transporter periplasmic protein LptC [Roseateles sp. SL47]
MGPRRRVQPLLWRLQSFLASYVPLLLMAALAGFTWWLIKSTPQLEAPREKAAPRHVPDYRMQGFELERFSSDGRLLARILGHELRHYPDNDTIEIDQPELRAYGDKGELLIAQAKRGLSNGDGSEVQLLGDVKLHRYPSGDPAAVTDLELYGEFLHVFVPEQKMRSHLPARVVGLGGEMQVRSFEYSNLSGLLTFSGGGKAQFSAQPAGAPAAPAAPPASTPASSGAAASSPSAAVKTRR